MSAMLNTSINFASPEQIKGTVTWGVMKASCAEAAFQ